MSTDIEPYEQQQTASDPTGGRLVAWAEGLAAAHRIGTALCQTAFVPASFRGKPEEAAAAILYGDEIGFTPTQALQNIFVISGKPSMYARSMVALVLHHGHEVWTVEKSDAKVTVAGKRRGSTHVIEETWTTARASKAGYTNNKKYTSDPQAMLYARAASTVCREIAPDALAGLAYSIEEMEISDTPTTTVRRDAAKTTTAKRKEAAPPTPEPDLEPEPPREMTVTPTEPATEEPTPKNEGEPAVTKSQMKMMHASFSEAGIAERDQRLAYASKIAGRELETSNELTKAEASLVIDALTQDVSPVEPTADPEPEWK